MILSGTGRALGAQRRPALFDAFPSEDWDIFLRTIVEVSYKPESPDQAAVMLDIFHQSYEQRNFLLMVAAANRFSLGGLLPQLKTPTLVLNTRTSALVSAEESSKVAQLAKAKFVLLDGLPPTGDVNQALRAIDAFLADLPSTPAPEPAPVGGGPAGLSPREVEVLRLIAAGRSNQQIADELVISARTVERHVANVFDKTGSANRAQAAVYAKEHGLV